MHSIQIKFMKEKLFVDKPLKTHKKTHLSLETLSDLSTLRTRNSKQSQTNRYLRKKQIGQTLRHLKYNRNSLLCEVLSDSNYSHRPVSLVSIWCCENGWLDVLLQNLVFLYNGWLEDDYQPHFNIFGSQLVETFILFSELNQQKYDIMKMLLEYAVSDLIFLILYEDDLLTQNKILSLCQKIGDILLIDESIYKTKPSLILCKVSSDSTTSSTIQSNWRSFVNKLNSWRHFKEIDTIEISSLQFQHQLQRIGQTEFGESQQMNCFAHIKQIIRRKSKPQQIMGQLVTGNIMANFIKQLYSSLSNESYIHMLNLLRIAIEFEKKRFQEDYGDTFSRLIEDRMESSLSLSRYGLFRCFYKCRREAQKLFSIFGTSGHRKIIKAVERSQLKLARKRIQVIKQQNNEKLFQYVCQKYLNFRPVAFSKCKSHQYTNNGCLQDLRNFIQMITRKFAEELLLGQELNGLNTMNIRIESLIGETKFDVEQNQQKLERLKNKQYVRQLEYSKKSQIAKNIKRGLIEQKSMSMPNTLESLMMQKISRQIQKIQDLSSILNKIQTVQNLEKSVNLCQKEWRLKQNRVQQLERELASISIQNAKMKTKEVRFKVEQNLKKQQCSKQYVRRKQDDLKITQGNRFGIIEVTKQKKRKKGGIFGCFGC